MTKALFFDIDGTLVSFETHRIPPSTIEALEAAHAKGLKIFIATGRPKAIINNLSELQDRNLIDGYITMNGAYCFIGEQVIYKSAIPQEEVKAMAAFCEKKGVPCIFVEEHNISVCQPNDMVKKIFYDFLHVNVIPTVSFEEATSKEVIQMTPFITEEEEKEIRPSIPTCEVGRWFPAFADITAKGDTKQKGIDEIIRYFDMKLEETMAFGDGGNDISMLRHAAIGIAMGQAKEDVKAAADYVTASIDEDGISKAMKQLSEVGLIEKKKRGQGKPDIIYVMNFTAVHKEGAKEIVLEEQMEQDYQDKLAYILMHPFRNWFNRKTPAVIGIALTVWAMFVCYYLTYYRNFHPDAEHGVAEWADVPKTAKRLYGKGEEPVTCLSKNITVNAKSLPNMHILILGGSGDGKTTSLLIPNILLANMTNIILDVKGDLLKNYGGYLKEKRIAVKSINFKDMAQSDQYNPFRYIENYTDMVELITNIQTSVKSPDAQKGDPFWDDGVGLYLQSLFEYEWLQEKEEGRTASMLGILDLVNKETQKTDEEGTTQLQQDMQELQERYGEDYPPVRDYRKLKEGASETVRSIVIMVNAQLRLFEIPEIKRIFEGTDDIDIPSLGLGVDGNPEKKTALFLVMPSGDSSYNLFINMFYTQLFTVLKRIADNRRDGQLPIHVRLWADEYYAGPKPLNCETLLGEIRSRNMSIVPILQDIAQIKTLYPNDKWEIFTGNCATTVFLGSGATAHTTHQWVSDMLEDMTIDSRSESLGHSQGSGNLQMSKAGMKLMTPGQISRMPKNDCILFLKGERPIYDKKNWPFNTEVFKEAEKIAGQNGYKNPVYVSYDERNKKYITTRFESRLNYISKEEFTFFEEKAKEDSSIQTFQIDEEAFLYLNFNETPQPSLRELEKMVKEIQVAKVNEEEEEKETDQQPDMLQDRGQWDLSGDIIDCFRRYSSELSPEEQEEIIKGIEEGMTD